MAACRLIPKTDDGPFPYEDAMRVLFIERPAMTFWPKDFEELIAAGRSSHWSTELILAHEEMAKRGRCFDFVLEEPPYLRGTLFEDNIWFSFDSWEHEEGCLPVIDELREQLDVRILHH